MEEVIDVILIPMTNLVFVTGKFKRILKKTIVVPLLKKGINIKTTNYRAISLISIFAKTIEKAVHIEVMKYLNKYYGGAKKIRQFHFSSLVSKYINLLCFKEK